MKKPKNLLFRNCKNFEAEVSEKAIPLHSKHLSKFRQVFYCFPDLLEKKKQGIKIDTTQGPMKKANAYLDAI